MIRPMLAALSLLLLPVSGACAQSMDMSTHSTMQTPAGKALTDVNGKMMQSMHAAPTGDADRDFAAMMLAHHEGAVGMAKVELQHGRDAELRALAEAIIAAQGPEIEQLRAWLERRK